MNNPISHRISKDQFTSSLWVMRARWYYTSLAYILGVISAPAEIFSKVLVSLSVVFFISIIANAFLFYYLEHNNAEDLGETKLKRINASQIAFDLVYIYLILVLSGVGLSSFVQIFYFLPIIIAMMFFGSEGTIIVSLISSVFLLLVVMVESGLIIAMTKNMEAIKEVLSSKSFNLQVAQSSVVVLIYLLVGFFSSSVAKLLSKREGELQKQFLEEELNVKKLSDLTKDFELSSKLLVRRDIELTIANERMHELDEMKTEIISVAAHQLRTPLSGIKWMLKMILDEDAGKITIAQREWLLRGFDSNERLIKTVNDLLEVDRLESGRVKYIFSSQDLSDLVQKAMSDLLQKATKKKIHIEFKTEGIIPRLHLDAERIIDMLQNLIDNSIKYSRENSMIYINIVCIEEFVRLSISDSGIGVPLDEQKNIFSRFFRAQNAMSYDTEGSGLGLAIVNNIVQRHGANISFKSKEGEGTTFYIDFPINLVTLKTDTN